MEKELNSDTGGGTNSSKKVQKVKNISRIRGIVILSTPEKEPTDEEIKEKINEINDRKFRTDIGAGGRFGNTEVPLNGELPD